MPRRQSTATARSHVRVERRHRTIAIVLSLIAIVAVVAPATARAAAGWRLPVDGAVVGGFRVTPGAPFAAGQRRGIDLQTWPGAAVRAACSGRVTFAGRVPLPPAGAAAPSRASTRGRPSGGRPSGGRASRGRASGARAVTIRCAGSPYLATHVGPATIAVRRGAALVRGTRIGTVGSTGRLRLGARHTGDRRRYIDPRILLNAPGGGPPLAPPAAPLAVRRGRPPSAPSPARAAEPPASPATVPLLAWIGLALVAAGAPMSLFAMRLRRRRIRTRTAADQGPAAAAVR